jgi:predicted HTH domain antitoxin
LNQVENDLSEKPDWGFAGVCMTNVTVEIPAEVLTLAGLPGGSDSHHATRLLALELYREGRVSLGGAAELAGAGVEAFMEFSARRQVALHYAEADLAGDRATRTA